MCPNQLRSTVDCLLRNAICSAAPGDRISVRFEMANEIWCITVSDNVSGNHQESFSNIEQSSSENARLFVENVSDQGNAFMLSFPLRGT